MSRTSRLAFTIVAAVAAATIAGSEEPKFYPDDPLWQVPESQDASNMKYLSISLLYDLAENVFTSPGEPKGGRARGINTIDEVPDSSWFENRIIGARPPMTVADVARGPNRGDGPAPGTWTVVAGKTDGVTPGMTIVDEDGDRYFIKFDPLGYEEMATGAEVVSTKLFHALGYHVPENYIAHLDRARLAIDDDATKKFADGRERPLRTSDLDRIFRKVAQRADGTYRVLASKALPGRPVGGFRYTGTRTDDPNDIVPHEARRELRGLRAGAAWLNHVDCKAINTLDVLVDVGERTVNRHHLIDFGSTLGSAAIAPREAWEGFEYVWDTGETLRNMPTFGLRFPPWAGADFPDLPAVGRFESLRFDPAAWVPRVPNQAFTRARPDDLFWAARRIMAIGDDMLRAVIETAEYSEPAAREYLFETLRVRRDKIGRTFLPAVNPLVDLTLDAAGTLRFDNAAVAVGLADRPAGYRAVWHRFDNRSGATHPLGTSEGDGAAIAAPAALSPALGSLVRVDVSAIDPPHPSLSEPLQAFFRRDAGGWKLVGLVRVTE